MKLIITEGQKKLILESIHPSEAYTDINAVKTLCQGKRGVCFVAGLSEHEREVIGQMMLTCNLDIIKVPSNPHEAYILYRAGYEENAHRLLHIAEKYGGYLDANAADKDTREIGRLLEYDDNSVEEFIKKMHKLKGIN